MGAVYITRNESEITGAKGVNSYGISYRDLGFTLFTLTAL